MAAPAARPHVCFVAPNLYPVLAQGANARFVGGAEVQQVYLARGLVAAGCRVTAITLDHGQRDGEMHDGVRVLKCFKPSAGLPGLRYVHPRISGLWRAMRRADADVYYQRSASMLTGLMALFGRLHGRPTVFSGASDTNFIPARENICYARDRALFRYGLRHADGVVLQTDRQQALLQQHYGRRGVVIRSCYEAPDDAADARHGGLVLWVGTIREVKRPELFVEIARRLPGVRFRLVGGPTEGDAAMRMRFEALQALAAGVPNLKLAGFVPFAQVEAHFDQASVLVSTSSNEGFPNTFLQAWARGIPVVSTFDAGSAEPDGALPFAHVGTADEAAAEIGRLTADHGYWQQRAQFSRDYFHRHHSIESTVRDYLALFDDLLARRRHG